MSTGYKGKTNTHARKRNPLIRKRNVNISTPFHSVSGKPLSIMVGSIAAESITITNKTTMELELRGMEVEASCPEGSFMLSLIKPPTANNNYSKRNFRGSQSVDDLIIRPRQRITIWLICCPKEAGPQKSTINICVGDDSVRLDVSLVAESGIAKAKGFHKGAAVGTLKPNKIRKSKVNRLKEFRIGKGDREFVSSHQIHDFLMNGPTRQNYASYFRTLVILEELSLEEEMKEFDMKQVHMKKKGARYLSLDVPALSQGRLSLVPGDTVYAELPTNDHNNSSIFKGTIKLLDATTVSLKFSSFFHRLHSDGYLYNIRFTYNRVNFRRIYQAIEAADSALTTNVLFPSERRRIQPMTTTTPISDTLNEEQRTAINYILACNGGAPYVIYGPPGTGKTKTLVELILQLYKTKPDSHILVCTSSNCAADHILDRMLSNEKETGVQHNEDILRLNAKSRPIADVDPDLIKYCFVEGSEFECPSLNELRSYRIIVSTYSSAHLLYEMGIDRSHFSNIILDEAGQATEPETMIPIANFSGRGGGRGRRRGCNTTVVVLAGDPKQLGPVVKSSKAEHYGLVKSYLERLCECGFYKEGDPNYVTMLVRNYRCHREILSLPSKLFYDGKLIAAKGEEAGDVLPWADMALNREFPVVFYGAEGQNVKQGSNPSWFNWIEVQKVMKIVRNLVVWKVKEHDIGVISPYNQQVNKIKNGLQSRDLTGIKVGSVEQFQGQEREVIIVSTVRSSIRPDGKCSLGFLSSPKRFNVAVTRAKSLLIIVGNPHTIVKDPCWERLLWHCVDHGSFQGGSLPRRNRMYSIGDSVLDEVQKRLHHLSINRGHA